jgi:phage-related protein
MYASAKGRQMNEDEGDELKEIVWEGDSREILSSFPLEVRKDFGFELYALQRGRLPSDWKPMKTLGKGVHELRSADGRSWYRVIYFTRVKDKIHVLHCFEKKSSKTSQKDLNLARQRLKNLSKRTGVKL